MRCSRVRPVRSSPRQSVRPLARCGITVVEVLVALVLVAVGLLSIAGSSALALRTATSASRERIAVRHADRRLARLASEGCARASAGTDSVEGMHERWLRDDSAGGVASLAASVEWQAGVRRRTLTLRSALVC